MATCLHDLQGEVLSLSDEELARHLIDVGHAVADLAGEARDLVSRAGDLDEKARHLADTYWTALDVALWRWAPRAHEAVEVENIREHESPYLIERAIAGFRERVREYEAKGATDA